MYICRYVYVCIYEGMYKMWMIWRNSVETYLNSVEKKHFEDVIFKNRFNKAFLYLANSLKEWCRSFSNCYFFFHQKIGQYLI